MAATLSRPQHLIKGPHFILSCHNSPMYYICLMKLMCFSYKVCCNSMCQTERLSSHMGDWFFIIWFHDDVIKWTHFPRYWPFVRGIQRSPVNSPHTGQWRGALMFSLICAWINVWVNNGKAGDLRRHAAHYDIILMICNAIMAIRDVTGFKLSQ